MSRNLASTLSFSSLLKSFEPSPAVHPSSLIGVMAGGVFAAGAASPSALEVSLAVAEAVSRPVEVRLVVPVRPPGHRQARVVARAPRVQWGAQARYLSQSTGLG